MHNNSQQDVYTIHNDSQQDLYTIHNNSQQDLYTIHNNRGHTSYQAIYQMYWDSTILLNWPPSRVYPSYQTIIFFAQVEALLEGDYCI